MNPYELLMIVSGKLKEADVQPKIDELKALLTKYGVVIDKEANWGRLKLAYQINHETAGTYVLWHVQIDPSKVAGLTRDMRVTEGVVRFLLVDRPKHGQMIAPATRVGKDGVKEVDSKRIMEKPETEESRKAKRAENGAEPATGLDKKLEEILGESV